MIAVIYHACAILSDGKMHGLVPDTYSRDIFTIFVQSDCYKFRQYYSWLSL